MTTATTLPAATHKQLAALALALVQSGTKKTDVANLIWGPDCGTGKSLRHLLRTLLRAEGLYGEHVARNHRYNPELD